MNIFLYLDRDSALHRLNPVTKIFGLLLIFIALMIFNHPLYLLPLFLLILLIGAMAKSLSNLRRIWILMLILAFFSFLLWSMFFKGPTLLFKLWFLRISKESLLYGLGMGIRLNGMILAGLIFISCTRIEEFTAGLNRLGLPFRACFALSLAFRLVPTFALTSLTIVQAQKSRGLDLESGTLLERIRKHIPLLVPIFVYAIRNTDLLAMALESKGFGARKKRSYLLEFRTGWQDFLALGFLLALNVAFILLRLRGLGVIL